MSYEDEVLAAAEHSLAEISSDECPPPLVWHPYYRGKTFLLDWLNGVGSLAQAGRTVRIPKPKRIAWASPDDFDSIAEVSFDVITMTKRRAWGPAPWVGKPFHYEWYVGVDDLGRCIASDSRIVYEEGRRLWEQLGAVT